MHWILKRTGTCYGRMIKDTHSLHRPNLWHDTPCYFQGLRTSSGCRGNGEDAVRNAGLICSRRYDVLRKNLPRGRLGTERGRRYAEWLPCWKATAGSEKQPTHTHTCLNVQRDITNVVSSPTADGFMNPSRSLFSLSFCNLITGLCTFETVTR